MTSGTYTIAFALQLVSPRELSVQWGKIHSRLDIACSRPIIPQFVSHPARSQNPHRRKFETLRSVNAPANKRRCHDYKHFVAFELCGTDLTHCYHRRDRRDSTGNENRSQRTAIERKLSTKLLSKAFHTRTSFVDSMHG